MLLWWICHLSGWAFDFDESPQHLSRFGYRRPDDNWPGIAFRAFGFELQFWKQRK
jgi:hypothetical protein